VTTLTLRQDKRRIVGLVVALVALLVLLVASVMIGSTAIAPWVVWDALFHPSANIDQFAIRDFRLPRTIVGAVVGVALGLSGALIQALTRNPLADPGIFGVHAGASFAVTVAVGLLGVRDIQDYMWFAFAGAMVVTLMVLALGSTRQGRSPVVMVLAGVCVGAVLGGFREALQLTNPDAFHSTWCGQSCRSSRWRSPWPSRCLARSTPWHWGTTWLLRRAFGWSAPACFR
jgi:ABC-type Fe3+-siderophore transport system permease subunit